CAPIYYGNFYW
nr:immunoglobulin heavy chain junction region [Mus musculus]MBK4186287.1 immunoglobulin heavy chain junction region [Mus musculus]